MAQSVKYLLGKHANEDQEVPLKHQVCDMAFQSCVWEAEIGVSWALLTNQSSLLGEHQANERACFQKTKWMRNNI